MRLLLVEDNVALADELCAGLQQLGYAVDWLTDGRDAAEQGAVEPYDLIILDLGLPELPGLEMLGNVLDNACKWADSRVELSIEQQGAAYCIGVDDDGSSVKESQREHVRQRGSRLDEGRARSVFRYCQ